MGGFSLSNIKFPQIKLLSSRREELAVGLDIGSHAVKVCQMAKTDTGYQLLGLGSNVLPAGTVEDGTLQEPEVVAKEIAALMKNLKIKQKKVAISISGYSVIVKKINLAVMDEKVLEGYIQNEVGQYIPFDIEDVYLDYHDLKTNTENYDRTDVMLVAAKKEVIDGYLAMLDSIGLQAVIVDVDGFALENAYEANFALNENVVLIDIGATKMSINIIFQGVSVLARDVVVGSRQLTEQIQDRLGVSMEDAEALKIGLIPAEEKQKEMEDIFISTGTQWAMEIKKAIDLYYNNHPDAPLSKLILSGGGARVTGLASFLNEEIGIPAEIFNPFERVEVDSKKIDAEYLKYMAPEMAIAVGLAIRPSEL
jgi:type IV pilus assembly protein PilM